MTTFEDLAHAELALADELAAVLDTACKSIMHSSAAEAALREAIRRQEGIAETWRHVIREYGEHGDLAARAAAASLIVSPSTATPEFLDGARHAAARVLAALQRTSSHA